MTECNFMIKNLSCNFGCMVLEPSLIKYVILLAYILYCRKKYTARGCARFVVLGGMIFKSTSFPPNASSSTSSSLCPDQGPQSTSEFVDKCGFKTDKKTISSVLSSSSYSQVNLRKHLEGTVFLFRLTHGVQTFHLVLGSILHRVCLPIVRPLT